MFLSATMLWIGCQAEPTSFHFNVVAKKTSEGENGNFSEQQVKDVGNILTAMFGTPEQPAFPNAQSFHWVLEMEEAPYADKLAKLVEIENLQRSAGPVSTDENGVSQGLYREHCAHCHGITGDGAGPTAMTLDPYPRDFRNGVFKFKSTTGKFRPTDEDLMRIINEGVHGTAMPSFKVALEQSEKEALVDYIKYLSIRGEVEMTLWDLTSMLEKEGRLPLAFEKTFEPISDDEYDNMPDEDPEKIARDELYEWFAENGMRIEKIFNSWINANKKSSLTKTTPPPASFATDHPEHYKMIDNGRRLFHGKKLGACTQCHGDTGYGDGELGNYDIWNKWAKGKNKELIAEYESLGVLPPRNIAPRNFRNGVFRGGRDAIQLFYRIKNGIQGSEMPGAATLTDEEIWCLVAYVRSIKSEPITGGHLAKPVNNKPIN